MTERKIVVLVDNLPSELPVGDTVDLSSSATFSFNVVRNGRVLIIPIDQQMLVHREMTIVDGSVIVYGEIVIL